MNAGLCTHVHMRAYVCVILCVCAFVRMILCVRMCVCVCVHASKSDQLVALLSAHTITVIPSPTACCKLNIAHIHVSKSEEGRAVMTNHGVPASMSPKKQCRPFHYTLLSILLLFLCHSSVHSFVILLSFIRQFFRQLFCQFRRKLRGIYGRENQIYGQIWCVYIRFWPNQSMSHNK